MPTHQVHRKRLTQAQRARILQDYHRSELPQREFAAQAGIGLSTLQFWLRNAANRASAPRPRFIEVPNPLSLAPAASTYRVHLAGGMQLEVGSGFRPEELTTLLQVLRGL
jgi:transposase-like protein